MNIPAQEISANTTAGNLDITNPGQIYSAIIDNDEALTASGYTL